MNQREQMTQMFDAIDSDSRRYVLAILRGEFERAQRARRPALRLVKCDRATTASAGTRPVLAVLPATQKHQRAAR